MKKITLTLLLVLFVNNIYSQVTYFNYLDYTSEWRRYGAGWNGTNSYDDYSTYYFDGDETLNGQVYYKQYSKRVITNYNTMQGTYSTNYLGGPYYIREDNTGKFYQYDSVNNIETVTFNKQAIVNAQLGDPFPYNGATCAVQSIETIYLGATPLKHINGNNNGTTTGSLEGIGVLGLACATSVEGSGGISCYTKQNVSIQFGTINCNSFPVPVRVNLSTNLSDFKENEFVIYPNPTNGILKVKFNIQETSHNYKIYNIYGVIIKEGVFENEEEIIDISNFTNGVYFLKINDKNSSEYKKIIKD